MWQNLLRHCAVLTKVSEEFAPHYLAGIRHDMRQTTKGYTVKQIAAEWRISPETVNDYLDQARKKLRLAS